MVRLRLLMPVALCALGVSFAAAQGAQQTVPTAPAESLTKADKDLILGEVQEIVTKRAFVPGVDLSKWPDYIAKQQDAIDKAEKDSEFARAVNAALRDFGVSHIRFLAPRVALARVRTSVIGVGLNARQLDGGLSVTLVFPKSPAEEAGVKQGDFISEIDGKAPDSSSVLYGDEGTQVKLKLKGADGLERELTLTRKPYSTLREDTLIWEGDDAAVLKVHSFANGYKRDVIESLMGQAAKAKYLILDLRSNGGGATTNLNHLLNLLLPPNTVIGTFVSRRTVENYKSQTGKDENDPVVLAAASTRKYQTRPGKIEPFKGKIAVLINRGSASASEICACCLQENANALLVGTNSAGAVLASVFRRLPHGYEIQYPIEDYVSARGVRLEKHPLAPDVEEAQRAEDGKPDPAVIKAIERLRSRS
jgi:carboxyl-terminal processing protease